jgi:hypothetical protein
MGKRGANHGGNVTVRSRVSGVRYQARVRLRLGCRPRRRDRRGRGIPPLRLRSRQALAHRTRKDGRLRLVLSRWSLVLGRWQSSGSQNRICYAILQVAPASCRHLLLRENGGRDARPTAGGTPALRGETTVTSSQLICAASPSIISKSSPRTNDQRPRTVLVSYQQEMRSSPPRCCPPEFLDRQARL